MFVMAVIQAIDEENKDDKCLFLFEEPESFLHENHQEYFYKTVLCGLAEKGHQVIYTTHSDRMVDITEAGTLIRLEFDKDKKQTIKTFPAEKNQINPLNIKENTEAFPEFNSYIKNIEPNLNKILFSEKVILVEGPNDLLVYNYLIKKKAEESNNNTLQIDKKKYSETYLNFNNIVIIPHHGKSTAYLLADFCKYLGVDYYLINDWDFDIDFIDDLQKLINSDGKYENLLNWESIKAQKNSKGKECLEGTIKSMITTNRKLINSAKAGQIHFNVKKLETIIDYDNNNKDSMEIWKKIRSKFKTVKDIGSDIFPDSLENFLLLKESEESKLEVINTLLL